MAKIYAMPNQAEWNKARGLDEKGNYVKGASYDFAEEERLYAKIPKDKIICFGVADGSAQYFVQSLKPLVICHVPYGDAYRADRLIEKALNVSEVKRRLKQQAGLRSLFDGRRA